MTIFQVTPLGTNTEVLEASIAKLPKEDVYKIPARTAGWLVRFNGTPLELTKVLGVPAKDEPKPEKIPTVLVTGIAGYYGFASKDMWEWIRSREGV